MTHGNDRPRYYLTTPIYYANARPHVGSAYTTLVADTVARFKRMQGYDVAFLTGTDEHGENIARAAAKAGITPRELVDRNSAVFRGCGTSWASATRISSAPLRPNICAPCAACCCARAIPATSTRRFYEGRYCVFDNLYVTDTTEPVDCPLCGRPAEIVSEENYFFKLSAFQDRLLKLYEDQPDFIRPAFRRNEILRFVEAGLRDISVSRKTVKWGLPWPDDPEHVVYVWYDALTSYLSGIGYGDDEMQYEKYWPAQLHLIGKEIIRFHCVYWPAFLMAARGAAAQGRVRARLAAFRSAEDEQVQGQRRLCRADRAHRRRRCAALLPAARSALRPGRQFQPRRAAHALQQRSGQRPGQSRQPHAGDDRALLRRRSARGA